MVVVADVDRGGSRGVASSVKANGGQARAAHVDVSCAEQVQGLVDGTICEHGRLDYMFNNAGIAMCAEVRDMELEYWQRIVNVNLWGVIHGTASAYRVMVQQGFGHIVNTASLGGLIPEPMATAYVATKHAVVGLSTSLRAEGAELGVKVSVVCPGMVKTRVLDAATYLGVRREEAIAEMTGMGMADVDKCVRAILRGVVRNKSIITDSGLTRVLWWLYRLNPAILGPFLHKGVRDIRALRIGPEMEASV
jgi:short-subunit dehydrogenase